MSAIFNAKGAAVAMGVGMIASSVVEAAGSYAAPLVLALPTIWLSPFAPFPQELYHPQRVFALDRMAGTTAAIKAGSVVDVLLQTATATKTLPRAEAWRRHRPVERAIRRCIKCGVQAVTKVFCEPCRVLNMAENKGPIPW